VTFICADLYDRVSHIVLKLYSTTAEHAASCRPIIADTEFEFVLVDHGELIVIDELLTLDWPLEGHALGRSWLRFDKQNLRD
jgi:phosphoribosylaminoimidazole-succinocarboxamide synthase